MAGHVEADRARSTNELAPGHAQELKSRASSIAHTHPYQPHDIRLCDRLAKPLAWNIPTSTKENSDSSEDCVSSMAESSANVQELDWQIYGISRHCSCGACRKPYDTAYPLELHFYPQPPLRTVPLVSDQLQSRYRAAASVTLGPNLRNIASKLDSGTNS
jgi:hypothetical protein